MSYIKSGIAQNGKYFDQKILISKIKYSFKLAIRLITNQIYQNFI